MRWLPSKELHLLSVVALLASLFVVVPPRMVYGATVEVNSVSDTDDGLCMPLTVGDCTLREAINTVNSTPASDTIEFNIPGGGLKTIAVNSALPTISAPVILNGFTQPGASANTQGASQGLNTVYQIRLDGTNAGVGTNGLRITGGSSTIKGLRIENFGGAGVHLQTAGSNVIQGNEIRNNETGISIVPANSHFNLVGGTTAAARNRISNNTSSGIELATDGNIVQGNLIGTQNDGSTVDGNGLYGVSITGYNNVIGGDTSSARNIIAGNGSDGININLNAGTGNLIQGNYIGTDVTGTFDRGNSGSGVYLANLNNTVGGTTAGARNVISGNNDNGIEITGTGTDGNVIQGNYIGTSAVGTGFVRNAANGIEIRGSAASNTIGGSLSGARNVIAGNGAHGIRIWSGSPDTNVIQGNYVGLDATGGATLANLGHGIQLEAGSNTTIGGLNDGTRNVISGNDLSGIALYGGSGTLIRGNYIGLNADGTTKRGNTETGVYVSGGSDTTIGGTATGARNVISGNGEYGVWQTSSATGLLVQGNYIGTNATGTLARGNGVDGVALGATVNTTVGGTVSNARNVISGNDSNGLVLYSGASGTQVQGNYIGTDAAGTQALPNARSGVRIATSDDNTVGGTVIGAGNVVAGNGEHGVLIVDRGENNQVQGNVIGAKLGGLEALPNLQDGVRIDGADSNTVGHTTSTGRNIVSGNGGYGVQLLNSANDNVVQGNYVGTNTAGTGAVANTAGGVAIVQGETFGGANNTLGGAGTNARNVISGNQGSGVLLTGAVVTNNLVQGNYIGTTAPGLVALGNSVAGIRLDGAVGNTVGGTVAAHGNVISGNGDQGIRLQAGANGNFVQGNTIGTAWDQVTLLPNASAGLRIIDSSENRIGGTTGVLPGTCTGACNRIIGNASDGVAVVGTSGRNGIRGNSISQNGGRGIDLNNDALTPNDPGDVDSGPNGLLNFPELVSATGPAGNTVVNGAYAGASSVTLTIEYFTNSVCDGSYGQGQTFQGAFAVATNAQGNATLNHALLNVVLPGQVITATATDANGNTSEFSNCVTAGAATPTPSATRTPTPSRTPTLTATVGTPSPTRTPTPSLIIPGHDFTLQGGTSPQLSWTAGQTNGIIVRWSPSSGNAFLPSVFAPLLPGETSYADPGTTPGNAYCYTLLAYLGTLTAPAGPDTKGISDLLCTFAGTGSGPTRPTQFRVALHETNQASLLWTAPGGQDRYEIRVVHFDATPDFTIPLPGTAVSREVPVASGTCFHLAAFTGATYLGSPEVVCTVPGIASYPAGGTGRLADVLTRVQAPLGPQAGRLTR